MSLPNDDIILKTVNFTIKGVLCFLLLQWLSHGTRFLFTESYLELTYASC
jgi:hypothetical protein